MKRDDLIASLQRQIAQQNAMIGLLKRQAERSDATIRSLQATVERQVQTINSLTDALDRLNATLESKDADLARQKRVSHGLGCLVANRSERMPQGSKGLADAATPKAPSPMEQAERKARIAARRKARGNNGAKRQDYSGIEMEEHVHVIEPGSPDFDKELARLVWTGETTRYAYVPAKFIRDIYRVRKYSCKGVIYQGELPQTPLLNSQFEGSFIAGVMEMRYLYGMPENRITTFFNSHGLPISRKTVNGLLRKSSMMLENLHDALGEAVKEDCYLSLDETYVRTRTEDCGKNGKHLKKGYMWDIIANNLGLVHFFYEEGSRKGELIYRRLKDYRGTIQSDGFAPYRRLGSDRYPHIRRLPCLQHIKRRFKDMADNPDACILFDLINQFYYCEKHPGKGVKVDTDAQRLRWRQTYSTKIIRKLRKEIDRIKASSAFGVDKPMKEAVTYLDNEMPDIPNIFTDPHYSLDNNLIERFNRVIAVSRKSSLFFGSHAGAKRGAIFYSLSASCRLSGVDFFDYMCDILSRLPALSPQAPYEVYREFLPDRWKPQTV